MQRAVRMQSWIRRLRRQGAPCAAALSVLLLWAAHAQALPIPAQTLWDLARDADLVVLARVEAIEPLATGPRNKWNESQAMLKVQEVWKGQTSEVGAVLRVPFSTAAVCPAPPYYAAGELVLAFLERDVEGVLSAVALSFATLYPAPKELPVYRKLVQRAATAPAAGATAEQAKQAWAVDAAVEPATRWHGAYALQPTVDILNADYDPEAWKQAQVKLSRRDLQRLARSLLDAPTLDVTFPMLLSILRDTPSVELDALAVAALDTVLRARDPPIWLDELFRLTRARVTAQKVAVVRHTHPRERAPLLELDAVRKEWTALRSRLPFPQRSLAGPVLEGHYPVRPDTPP